MPLLARRHPLRPAPAYEKIAKTSYLPLSWRNRKAQEMERVTISMSDEFAAELAAFVESYRYENRSEAVRDLALRPRARADRSRRRRSMRRDPDLCVQPPHKGIVAAAHRCASRTARSAGRDDAYSSRPRQLSRSRGSARRGRRSEGIFKDRDRRARRQIRPGELCAGFDRSGIACACAGDADAHGHSHQHSHPKD